MSANERGDWRMYAGGIGGWTVGSLNTSMPGILADARKQFPAPMQPKHVTVTIGANDMFVGIGGESAWNAHLTGVLDQIHAEWPSAHVWVALPWRLGYDAASDTLAGRIAMVVATRPAFAHIGYDERVWGKAGDNGATMMPDGVHYGSPTGQNEAAAQWEALLFP